MGKIILRHCPFCGDRAKGEHLDTFSGLFVVIKCGLCGAASKPFKVDEDNDDVEYAINEAVRKAANFWNRRVADEQREADL